MKKSTVSALIILIPLITIGILMLVGFETPSPRFTGRPVEESIYTPNQSVAISNGDYNISFSVDATLPVTIDKIRISSNVNEIGELTMCINNTAVNNANPLNYHLNSGDCLQVNFIMPCTEFFTNQTSITIFTQQAMYYQEISLPQNPSEPT